MVMIPQGGGGGGGGSFFILLFFPPNSFLDQFYSRIKVSFGVLERGRKKEACSLFFSSKSHDEAL